jgi:4'-phosphopantetheinyl transferase EntD
MPRRVPAWVAIVSPSLCHHAAAATTVTHQRLPDTPSGHDNRAEHIMTNVEQGREIVEQIKTQTDH